MTKNRHLVNFNMEMAYKYPIKVVSQMTGLSVHVIRAWEKRYNVVEPDRTDTNRRLYSEKEIEKLKLLKTIILRGNYLILRVINGLLTVLLLKCLILLKKRFGLIKMFLTFQVIFVLWVLRLSKL